MRKKWSLLHVTALIFITQVTWAGDVKTEKVTLVGGENSRIYTRKYDVARTPL